MTMANSGGRSVARTSKFSGFTLIELLVVIVIIALLVAMLLPALRDARLTAKMLREQSACRSMTQTWVNYAVTYKDGVIIPGIPWSWAHPAGEGVPSFYYGSPPDLMYMSGLASGGPSPSTPTIAGFAPRSPAPAPQVFIEGSCIKIWPLRFWGFAEFPGYEMQLDGPTYKAFRSRSLLPTATQTQNGETINTYDSGNNFLGAMSYHPTFGLNSVFNGGHYRMGAYIGSTATKVVGANTHFVRKLSDISKTSSLLVFASSRGVDLATSSMGQADYGGKGVPWTATSPIVPGFHMVTPPKFGQIPTAMTPSVWSTSDKFNSNTDPATWGFLFPKWKERAVASFADGHVEMQTIKQLRDMRKWSDKAKDANWNPTLK